jgi:formate/nitrite transporter FocA (FNT family)
LNTSAGTLSSSADARNVFGGPDHSGPSRTAVNPTETLDKKAIQGSRRSPGAAALRGAAVGLIFGIVIFGVLILIARANPLELRYLALYLSGIAFSAACWSVIYMLWNLGAPQEI